MRCRRCGKSSRTRRRRRRLKDPAEAVIASALVGVANQALANPLLLIPKAIEQEHKLTSCLGCGVVFVRAFKPNETCPMCLKTVGWREIGTIKGKVT